jgi:4-diphosphocytidyl-2-C-methyl-D-erythritol kinase
MASITEYAYAKVNLALHITGQRADGYHLLDSLVSFALACADRVEVTLGAEGFTVSGLMATPELANGDNLCVQAARLMGQRATIHLDKHLPIQAGIGGGSADAAAVLRALARAKGVAVPTAQSVQLGADVPVCCAAHTARMQGIGVKVTLLPHIEPLQAVLVNPRVHVPTPQIFKAITVKTNPPLTAPIPTRPSDLIAWLRAQRNDMQDAAISVAPIIAQCLNVIEGSDQCQLARMSGSGATCFGIYPSEHTAHRAAKSIQHAHPEWWVCATPLGSAPVTAIA